MCSVAPGESSGNRDRAVRRDVRRRLAEVERELGPSRASMVRRLAQCECGIWAWDTGDHPAPLAYSDGRPVGTVFHCDHRLCPTCAQRRSARAVRCLAPALRDGDYSRMVTLTHRDIAGEELKDAIKRFLRRWRRFHRRKYWRERARGVIFCIEATRNHVTKAWHVHAHMLCDLGGYEPQERLLAEWRKGYDGDDGGARIERVRDEDGLQEVAKYVCKGIDLVDVEGTDDDAHDVLRQACIALRGLRALRTYGTARGYEPDEADEDLDEVCKADEDNELTALGVGGYNIVTGEAVPSGRWGWRVGEQADAIGHAMLAADKLERGDKKRGRPPGWRTRGPPDLRLAPPSYQRTIVKLYSLLGRPLPALTS